MNLLHVLLHRLELPSSSMWSLHDQIRIGEPKCIRGGGYTKISYRGGLWISCLFTTIVSLYIIRLNELAKVPVHVSCTKGACLLVVATGKMPCLLRIGCLKKNARLTSLCAFLHLINQRSVSGHCILCICKKITSIISVGKASPPVVMSFSTRETICLP